MHRDRLFLKNVFKTLKMFKSGGKKKQTNKKKLFPAAVWTLGTRWRSGYTNKMQSLELDVGNRNNKAFGAFISLIKYYRSLEELLH